MSTCNFCNTSFTRKDSLMKHLKDNRCEVAKKMTVLDLLRIGTDEDGTAPNVLPHQMSTFVESLGDIYVKIVEVQHMVSQAYKSNIAKDTKKIKKGLVEINKNLQKQKQLIQNCGKLIDKLG